MAHSLVSAPLLLATFGVLAISPPERVARVVDMEPAVSMDGTLAFASNRSGEFEIYTIGADGNALTRLSDGGGKDTPAWSPNGESIAFVSEAGGNADIFVIARTGGEATRITSNPLNDIHPFWSPNGKQVVFTRYTPDETTPDSGRLDVYVMNADGSGEKLLVTGGSYGSLSPDSKNLLYWRYFAENADIAIANADGRHERRLTRDAAFDGWPAWSHDGQFVAFAREQGDGVNLFIIDVASEETHQVTFGAGRKSSPKWSTDDRSIYFDGTIDGAQGIWRVEIRRQ